MPPLPRAILGPILQSGAQDLVNNAYWTTGYVGLGPYKLDRWEPGAFLEASAFDRHVLGKPKIQQIKLVPCRCSRTSSRLGSRPARLIP